MKGDFLSSVSQEVLSRFIWKFLWIHLPISCVHKKIFSSTNSALGILWISVLKERLAISIFHIFTLESDRRLKVSCNHILRRFHCRENFCILGQIIRQGHFGQKQVFRQKPYLGPRFCQTAQAYNLIFFI